MDVEGSVQLGGRAESAVQPALEGAEHRHQRVHGRHHLDYLFRRDIPQGEVETGSDILLCLRAVECVRDDRARIRNCGQVAHEHGPLLHLDAGAHVAGVVVHVLHRTCLQPDITYHVRRNHEQLHTLSILVKLCVRNLLEVLLVRNVGRSVHLRILAGVDSGEQLIEVQPARECLKVKPVKTFSTAGEHSSEAAKVALELQIGFSGPDFHVVDQHFIGVETRVQVIQRITQRELRGDHHGVPDMNRTARVPGLHERGDRGIQLNVYVRGAEVLLTEEFGYLHALTVRPAARERLGLVAGAGDYLHIVGGHTAEGQLGPQARAADRREEVGSGAGQRAVCRELEVAVGDHAIRQQRAEGPEPRKRVGIQVDLRVFTQQVATEHGRIQREPERFEAEACKVCIQNAFLRIRALQVELQRTVLDYVCKVQMSVRQSEVRLEMRQIQRLGFFFLFRTARLQKRCISRHYVGVKPEYTCIVQIKASVFNQRPQIQLCLNLADCKHRVLSDRSCQRSIVDVKGKVRQGRQ